MRIQVEKFLALTALLAGGSLMSVGCVTEDTKTDTDAGVSGGGGTGGGTGGSAGSGGAAGSAGSGGQAGSGGSAGSDGGGDAGACLGDTGVEADCSTLPYAATICGDAGAEGGIMPLGYDMCVYTAGYGRKGVQEKMLTCLKAISGDACSSAHDAAVQKCLDQVFPQACQHPALAGADGGTYDPCKDVAESCKPVDGGTSGVTEEECNAALNPLTVDSLKDALVCYDKGTGDCRQDFEDCLLLPK